MGKGEDEAKAGGTERLVMLGATYRPPRAKLATTPVVRNRNARRVVPPRMGNSWAFGVCPEFRGFPGFRDCFFSELMLVTLGF